MKATGKRIKQIMDMNGFNIGDISELMNISYQAVRKWIKGETLPEMYTSVNARGLMSYYFRISRMIRLQMSS